MIRQVVVVLGLVAAGCCQTCPARPVRREPSGGMTGALVLLSSSARGTREAIVGSPLPYQKIRLTINSMYNQTKFSAEPFVSLWVDYSLNFIYISAFVLFVGVVCPLLVAALWFFWECCHGDAELEEADRHGSVKSQLATWCLAVMVFILLLLVSVFACILLSGNSLLSESVAGGRGAMLRLLPQASVVRETGLEQLEAVVVSDYNALLNQINSSLSQVAVDVGGVVREGFVRRAELYRDQVLAERELGISLTDHTHSLLEDLSMPSPQLIELNTSLCQLIEQCSVVMATTELTNSAISGQCGLVNKTLLLNNNEVLDWLVAIETQLSAVSWPIRVEERLSEYLSPNLSSYLAAEMFAITNQEVGVASDLSHALEATLATSLSHYNDSTKLGLDSAQQWLDLTLGPRQLLNWDVIRSACTLTFGVFILVLALLILLPVGRGLLNVWAVYREGEELTHLESAHLAGLALKRVSLLLIGVCFVSSALFAVFITLVGVLGEACGRHGNFSSLLSNVVDHPESWAGSYPLGGLLLENSSVSLTIEGSVNRCRDNQSLYTAFQLNTRTSFSEIAYSDEDYQRYVARMRGLYMGIPPYHPLTPAHSTLLTALSHAHSLPRPPIPPPDHLSSVVADLITALSETPDASTGEMNDTLLSIEKSLSESSSYLLNVSASLMAVVQDLSLVTSPQLLSDGEELADSVRDAAVMAGRASLSVVSTEVGRGVVNYTDTARVALQCSVGDCTSLAGLYDEFSESFCDGLVPALDVSWSSSLAVLALGVVLLPLCLLLASRLVDNSLNSNNKFVLLSAVTRQLRAAVWLGLSLLVCGWLVVSVATDDYYNSCCCAPCLWSVGIVFIVMTTVVGGASRIYQAVIVYRIKQNPMAKVKRYWLNRKKAIQFFTQLLVLLLQDVPFLILGGVYAAPPNTLTLPSLFAVATSLLGIASYLLYLIQERGSILTHLAWLRGALLSSSCVRKGATVDLNQPQDPQAMQMSAVRRGRFGSSESEVSLGSQGTTQQDTDFQFSNRLSNIPEQPEGVPHPLPRPIVPPGESESELSQARPASTAALDNVAQSRRQPAGQLSADIEIAPRPELTTPTSTDYDLSMSEYGARSYFSSHDEYYRDTGSEFSSRSQLPRLQGEVSLEV